MAKDQTRRLRHEVLAEDEAAVNTLQNVTGYVPANPDYAVARGTQIIDEMRAARVTEDQIKAALATARDVVISKEWTLHNYVLGVKDQVKAQFGKDSLQLQELGLKRVSEYKSRRVKKKPDPQ